ncbi:hypothetical protein DFS34DRAFT_426417 [Phlyctochytrium arcticum]|nr:hypothetical protein DFS34DRAFT_426417 [Phlyctochytrium arcticum]
MTSFMSDATAALLYKGMPKLATTGTVEAVMARCRKGDAERMCIYVTVQIPSNPVLQAQWYCHNIEVLLRPIFGWDKKSSRPRQAGGIFGTLEPCFFADESQGRLVIHSHGLAWIGGMPRTDSEWGQKFEIPSFRDAYKVFCQNVFSHELPVQYLRSCSRRITI